MRLGMNIVSYYNIVSLMNIQDMPRIRRPSIVAWLTVVQHLFASSNQHRPCASKNGGEPERSNIYEDAQ